MSKPRLLAILLVIGIFAISVCPASRAQTSAPVSANADIVKMIQAGLPESTVVNKIREGAGHWDTSVDALITLKQAGATEAELGALTAAPAQKASTAQQAETAPVEAFGSQLLHTKAGGPYLRFESSRPGIFPNGIESNTASLVVYKGEVGVLIPSFWSDSYTPFNAIFLRDRLVMDNYLTEVCCENAIAAVTGIVEQPKVNLSLQMDKKFSRWGNDQGAQTGGNLYTEVRIGTGKKSQTHPALFGIFPFMETDYTAERAALMDPFVQQLMSSFDKTVAEFERAAGITDPITQLSSVALYEPITAAQAEQFRVITLQRMREIKRNDRSNGWLSALNAMQGVANMQQAVQDAKVADLSHNTAGQLRAAANAGTAEMQTLGAVSGGTTPIQPLAPAVLSQTQPTLPQPTPNAVASTPQKAQSGFTYQVSHGQPESKTVASNTGSVPPAANSQPRANPNPGGVPSGVSTGTAPAANCVYLSDAQPCVPLAQWQQMQANQPIRVPVEVCPKSGFVPGLMRKVSSDVSEGVPCTPGQPIDPSVFASGSSSVSNSGSFGGSSGSSTSGGGNSSGSGVSNTGGPSDPILNDCIGLSYKNDPITGDHLIILNNCSIRAQVYFYASSQVSGGEALDPGEAGNTYAAHDKILAAGGVSIYACPVGDVPRQADGTLAYNGVNNHFLCSRK